MIPRQSLYHAKRFIIALCAVLALSMLVDYTLFSQRVEEKISGIHTSQENYYNAGANAHYSYRVQTAHFDFPVSHHFASMAQEGQPILLTVSPIFGEVNLYQLQSTGDAERHSLRIVSGLVVPLLVLLVLFLGLRYKEKLSTLVFVAEVAVLANLLYLLT